MTLFEYLSVAVSILLSLGMVCLLSRIRESFPFFLLALVAPSLICVQATSLVPRDASNVRSWREYYFRIHGSFFAVYASIIAAIAVQAWLLRGVSISDPSRLYQAFVFSGAVAAAFTKRESVHALVALAMLLAIAVAAGTLLTRPVTT